MSNEYPHFSDFADAEDTPLSGEKRKIADILDREILIMNFQIKKSKIKDGNYATIQFQNGGTEYVVFTASGRLMKQLEQSKDKMPFFTTIIQEYKYFTMS
ncbi:MAG: hypothetical protein U9N01_04540 [Euryarchaeota archaeon]|nr:hypothetical protein [Euryarchaeota archaeon]